MKINIRWWLLVLSLNVNHALEVKLTEEYYSVAPTNLENLQKELLAAAVILGDQVQHKIVGEYSASVQIKHMDLHYRNGQCQVKRFELALDGVMTLPELKMGKYPLKLQLAFEAEVISLKQHELKHELIWKTFLQEYETNMKKIVVSDIASCPLLTAQINEQMESVLEKINRQNMIFDCLSYGKRLNLAECNND